jgi:hypothetical protein
MRQRAVVTHSLVQQAFALRGRFPDVNAVLTPRRLVWTGAIQPTAMSRVYAVRIAYAMGRYPEVRVLRPGLETRFGETLPHVFGDGSLCLHLEDEWTPDMLIVDTTVPWTAEWLINYEVWKATGEWYGGGEWPPRRPADAVAEPEGGDGVTSPVALTSERR